MGATRASMVSRARARDSSTQTCLLCASSALQSEPTTRQRLDEDRSETRRACQQPDDNTQGSLGSRQQRKAERCHKQASSTQTVKSQAVTLGDSNPHHRPGSGRPLLASLLLSLLLLLLFERVEQVRHHRSHVGCA